jgi:hypothetical protein
MAQIDMSQKSSSSVPDIRENSNESSNMEGEETRTYKSAPAFAGPGTSASKPGGVKAHRFKILNKLDPRLNADILEHAKNGTLKGEQLSPESEWKELEELRGIRNQNS